MHRALTTLLVLLALTGVVSGNLLKPCDCTAGEEAGGRALRHSRVVDAAAPRSCCGGCQRDVPGDAPGEAPSGEDPDDEGCTLCCKPRPPLAEAASSITLADAEAVVVAVLDRSSLAVAAPTTTTAWTLTHERRTRDPWLLAPEGLAVFLI